ncbi:DUF2645 family protein [Rhodoferax sp.]|uniref:DUF2645 family protein n=1 Tax=Rhodoferax sp. TaxID=50421 RepID=UPI00275AB427|nr:DUF2645 family protein [Rhodoferax sp.]
MLKWTTALRPIAHTVYGLALLLMAMLSRNKYRWMSELDESIAVGAIEDAANNNAVVAVLLLILALSIQIVLLVKSRNTAQRVTAAALMVFALAVWLVKAFA